MPNCARVDRTAAGSDVKDRSVYNCTTQHATLPVCAEIQAVYARKRRASILLISLSESTVPQGPGVTSVTDKPRVTSTCGVTTEQSHLYASSPLFTTTVRHGAVGAGSTSVHAADWI